MASFETNDVAVQRSVAVLLWTWNHKEQKGVVLRSVKQSRLVEQLNRDRDLISPPAAPTIARRDNNHSNDEALIRNAGEAVCLQPRTSFQRERRAVQRQRQLAAQRFRMMYKDREVRNEASSILAEERCTTR